MNNYLINKNTIALIQLKESVKIMELGGTYFIKGNVYDIIDNSCKKMTSKNIT